MDGENCPTCRSAWQSVELDETVRHRHNDAGALYAVQASFRCYVTCARGHRFEARTWVREVNRVPRYEGLVALT